MTDDPQSPCLECTILLLEDEEGLAELYSLWLAEDYEVRTANTAAAAREQFDDDVDVALIDRRLPDEPGDDVLRWIRRENPECRTAMVTAINPDFEIVDMPFDDYLVKPIEKSELRETVRSLGNQQAYGDTVRELYALVTKKAQLEAQKSERQLEASEEYAELENQIEEVAADAQQAITDFDWNALDATMHRLSGDSSG